MSSLIAQGTEFPLRKPPGFHWDIFLLGCTTGLAGILGIPFPNGLIPQAPFHTQALCVTRQVVDEKAKGHIVRVTDHVVEQRFSNLAQGQPVFLTFNGVISAANSLDGAVAAMKMGAFDYFTKPVQAPSLVAAIKRAVQLQNLTEGHFHVAA